MECRRVEEVEGSFSPWNQSSGAERAASFQPNSGNGHSDYPCYDDSTE